jgi:hypothetical protein
MNRTAVLVLGAVFAASFCYGQGSTAAPAQAVPTPIGHGAFPVKVIKTLDSSKLKADDSVEVETVGAFKLPDGTLVPKGSKLTGRVTSAKARSKGDPESQLTLTFNQLNIANGKQLSIKGTVQALYPPADEPMGPNMSTAGTSAGGSAGGPGLGAASQSGGVGLTNAKSGSDTESTTKSQGVIDVKATGVQGLDNLQLNNGVLTSKGKNVKLGDGVRMVVHVDIFG